MSRAIVELILARAGKELLSISMNILTVEGGSIREWGLIKGGRKW